MWVMKVAIIAGKKLHNPLTPLICPTVRHIMILISLQRKKGGVALATEFMFKSFKGRHVF